MVFGVTRNVFIMGIVSFLTDVSTEMIYPLLPLFLTLTLGASITFVGLVEGVAESTASVLKLFSGWLSDKISRRKTIVLVGYTLSSLTRPLVPLSTAAWHILVVRFLDRVGKGVRTSPRDALISDSSPPDLLGRAFGFHRAMDHMGAVVGPIIAFLLINSSGISVRGVFWLASIPALLSIVTLMFVDERRRQSADAQFPTFSLNQFDQNFRRVLGVILLFTLGNSSDAFLILRATGLGVSIDLVPLLWVALHLVKMSTSFPGGVWSDHIGRKTVIIAGWIVYSAIYLGFALAQTSLHIWVLFALYGIYFGLTEGAERAFIADLVPQELQGTAYGVYHFTIGLAALPASLIMGILWDKVGVSVAFAFGAVLSLVAAFLLGVMVREGRVTSLPHTPES
ncbi:MAG: MFS transporter [Candidatus Tectomicrobia bacterium]|nr:MFS transporter [Candidatus Tectomicrobia bacterium]